MDFLNDVILFSLVAGVLGGLCASLFISMFGGLIDIEIWEEHTGTIVLFCVIFFPIVALVGKCIEFFSQ